MSGILIAEEHEIFLRHSRRSVGVHACLALVAGVTVIASAPSRVCAQDAERIAILFRNQASHLEAATALETRLLESGHACTLIELPKTADAVAQEAAVRKLVAARPSVVASAGTKATLLALQTLPDTPVVFFMVPNALDARFMARGNPYRHRVGGVTTDISPEDQLDWILRIIPDTRTIAVPHSERSARTFAAIESAGRKRGVTIRAVQANKENFVEVIERLNADGCDGVLMIPDANVYSSLTVQRLLLWGIRQKKPVWAFSENVVRAGALGGIHGVGGAVGHRVAGLVQQVINGKDIARIGLKYPMRTGHAVNDRTAQMIGVSLPRHKLASDTARFGSGK